MFYYNCSGPIKFHVDDVMLPFPPHSDPLPVHVSLSGVLPLKYVSFSPTLLGNLSMPDSRLETKTLPTALIGVTTPQSSMEIVTYRSAKEECAAD